MGSSPYYLAICVLKFLLFFLQKDTNVLKINWPIIA